MSLWGFNTCRRSHDNSGGIMTDIAAVISIASEGVYLNISESNNGQVKKLEYLYQSLNIGQETFNYGRISFKKVDKICKILENYKQVIREYAVKKIKVVSTTALREAKNITFILDQIKSRTRFDVQVLDDPQEKSAIYKAMLLKIDNTKFKNDKLFLGYIGTGSLGIAICKDRKITYSQNVRIGSVKLLEILRSFQSDSENAYRIINEYLSSFVKTIKSIPDIDKVEHFITCGQEIENIIKMSGERTNTEIQTISVKKITDLFENIKTNTPEQIGRKFNLPEHDLESLLPSMGIYKMFFDIVKTSPIISVPVKLSEAILLEMFSNNNYQEISQVFAESTVISAKNLGSRFLYDEEHANQVEKLALSLFDLLKPKHRLDKRFRLLLQLAAILHDIGKFIQLKNHSEHSANIIKGTELLGLDQRETEIVASVAKYHSIKFLLSDDVNLQKMEKNDRLVIAKLLAILRIADALDRSHSSKVKDIKVQIKSRKLKIKIISDQRILLEKWSIETKSEFFEDVFGLKPEITKE